MKNFNEEEVRRCYQFLEHLNESEVRLIDPKKVEPPISVFVSSEDEFVEVCKKYNGKYNIYVGINEREKGGTKKQDVISVKTLVIDVDAIKSKGFEKEPATNEELLIAEKIIDNIIKSIKKTRQVLPVKLCSGNGYQLWFAIQEIKIDDINRQEIENKCQLFQEIIIEKFDINNAIDKIGDLPRIIKVWGTYNIKGKESDGRNHRVAIVVGDHKRVENKELKKRLLELKKDVYESFETEEIEEINFEDLPPCINHLLKFYENKDGNYWYRLIQCLASFFMSVGLKEEKTKQIVLKWNKKQPYHEDGEEKEIMQTVARIYRNQIKIPNCAKMKSESGGFPYFGLASLKLCKPDNKCKGCINPIIRYKRGLIKKGDINSISIKLDNYIENANLFYEQQPFFFDKSEIFWFWDAKESRWEIKDNIDVMLMIDNILGLEGQTVNSHTKANYLEAFKRIGRNKMPVEAPVKWIQFKDKAFSIKSKKIYEVRPNYFFTNPIPWEIGKSDKTPVMDMLFKEWVGERYVKDLYEIIAYCCYRSYPIQLLFCLYGGGRNGKTSFIKLLGKFIGDSNVTSTELDLLTGRNFSRFESFKLYKKLVCFMGETNFGLLTQSSMIKKLTGGDLIGYEMKGKKPFDDNNYAKMLIASNSLPTSEDTSEGFYRRWHIIPFTNVFPEGKDILDIIPKEEYNNLANKIVNILPKLLGKGWFSNQGSIDERKTRYTMASNPFPLFLDMACERESDSFIRYSELFTAYTMFLKEMKVRRVSKREFSQVITDEGYETRRTSKKYGEEWVNDRFIEGIGLKESHRIGKYRDKKGCKGQTEVRDFSDFVTLFVPQSLYKSGKVQSRLRKTLKSQDNTIDSKEDNDTSISTREPEVEDIDMTKETEEPTTK